jgi:hypothetical protein
MMESRVKRCAISAMSRLGLGVLGGFDGSAAYLDRILATMAASTSSIWASSPGTSLPLYPAVVWDLTLSWAAVSTRLNMLSWPGTNRLIEYQLERG